MLGPSRNVLACKPKSHCHLMQSINALNRATRTVRSLTLTISTASQRTQGSAFPAGSFLRSLRNVSSGTQSSVGCTSDLTPFPARPCTQMFPHQPSDPQTSCTHAGFGGRKRLKKQNDAVSSADMSSYKPSIPGGRGGRGGRGRGRGGRGAANRPGKARRAASRGGKR